MGNWIADLPLWVQTPLLFLVALGLCGLVGVVLYRLSWILLPPSAEEKRVV